MQIQNSTASTFPADVLLTEPDRRQKLVQLFYEKHHDTSRDITQAKDHSLKARFFCEQLKALGKSIDLGVDLGCRGAVLTKEFKPFGNWVGMDLDRNAIALAHQNGIPCIESDISTAIDFKDDAVDAVCLTEVLEHLPYPEVTVSEVHRILKSNPTSCFFGSVPIDYHLHRRIAVFRGKRLTDDPTHLRSFSFVELRDLLSAYFHNVTFEPLRGTKVRHRWLSSRLFIRDIAWFASNPRADIDALFSVDRRSEKIAA